MMVKRMIMFLTADYLREGDRPREGTRLRSVEVFLRDPNHGQTRIGFGRALTRIYAAITHT